MISCFSPGLFFEISENGGSEIVQLFFRYFNAAISALFLLLEPGSMEINLNWLSELAGRSQIGAEFRDLAMIEQNQALDQFRKLDPGICAYSDDSLSILRKSGRR